MLQRQPDQLSILSIDIGHHAIKAIASVRQGDTLICQQATMVSREGKKQDASEADSIGALKEALAPWKYRKNAVRVCMAGENITVRFIQIPKITKSELLANIGYESSKYIPYPLKDSYFDCDVFPVAQGTKDAKTTALIAAVKRQAVSDVVRLLSGLGVSAELLDVSPVALFNAFEAFGDENIRRLPTSALLDVGLQKSHFGIVHEGVPAFARDLDVGGFDFTQALSRALGVDMDKAEAAKKISDPSHLAAVFQRLAAEIKNSFDFFETERSTTVKGMVVTGGGALTSGVANFLGQVLEIPVTLWNPFESPRIHLEGDMASIKTQGPLFSVCLGLAAREEIR